MEFICNTLADVDIAASHVLKHHSNSRIFAVYGKMGAGKTTLIKSICKQLKVIDITTSPSFGIINEYKTSDSISVCHFDFYRIKNISEFLDLGCEEYFYSNSYCFIEWAEKIEDFLPENSIKIFIEENEGKRIITF